MMIEVGLEKVYFLVHKEGKLLPVFVFEVSGKSKLVDDAKETVREMRELHARGYAIKALLRLRLEFPTEALT
jgi:hypothetical protein